MQSSKNGIVRRDALGVMAGAATSVLAGPAFAQGAKPITGIIPVTTTPYTATGEVDYEDLAREMAFYNRCGANGAAWPQNGSDGPLLSRDERMKGMEVVVGACKPLRIAAVLGCTGNNQAEMMDYVDKAAGLGADGIILQPPPSGDSGDEAMYAFFAPIGAAFKKPVVIQPSAKNAPSLAVIQRLAKEFPNFGYIKEEGEPVPEHVSADVAAKPVTKAIFGASGGVGFLYELRLGSDGESPALGAYADVMAALLKAYRSGRKDVAADAFSKLLLMINCETEIPGTMRYVFKKRGVFKTTTARKRGAAGAPTAIVAGDLTPEQIAEIEFRFATLKPYLARGA